MTIWYGFRHTEVRGNSEMSEIAYFLFSSKIKSSISVPFKRRDEIK